MNIICNVRELAGHARRERRFASSHSTGLAAVLPLVFCMAFFWPFGGGGNKTVRMVPSQDVPAANGTVSVKTGPNQNTKIDLHVKNLAKPSALTPSRQVYVVWIEPPGQKPKNEGQLRVGKNLSGELHTVTPFKRFQVFITAENNPQATAPQGPRVLSAHIAES